MTGVLAAEIASEAIGECPERPHPSITIKQVRLNSLEMLVDEEEDVGIKERNNERALL